jgi:hypothetical protein
MADGRIEKVEMRYGKFEENVNRKMILPQIEETHR